MSEKVEKAHAEMMAAVQAALPNHGKMVLNQVYAIAETFAGKISNVRRSESAATIATQAAQIEALTKAIKHVASDAAEFSHGDDTAQRIVRGFSVRLLAALSNTGKP